MGSKDNAKLAKLDAEIGALRNTVYFLISWMAQSANSPIRPDEAAKLLKMLEPKDAL